MSDTSNTPRDAANWARKAESLTVGALPAEAVNLNVDGRWAVGPLQGFGQLWQKTYRAVRARRLWVKLAGGIPAGLLTLLFGAATGLALVGYSKLNTTYTNPPSQLQFTT